MPRKSEKFEQERIHLMIIPAIVVVKKNMFQKEEEDRLKKKRPRSTDRDNKQKQKLRHKQKLN